MAESTRFDKTPLFKLTPIESIVTEHAMLLMGRGDGEVLVAGTAVVVGPELLLTAAHVVRYLWETLQKQPAPGVNENQQSTFAAIAAQWPGEQSESAVWSITNATACPGTDLAFVKLKPGNDLAARYTWSRWLGLDLDIPALGSRVVAFGYPGAQVLNYTDEELQMFLRPSTAVGEVTAIYPERSERSMLNFPCYQVNARFDGGMSGGPVLNDQGRLCGIVCSGMPLGEDHISYVSALWPALFATLDYSLPGITFSDSHQPWELAKLNFLHAPGWESIYERAYIAEDDGAKVLRLRSL